MFVKPFKATRSDTPGAFAIRSSVPPKVGDTFSREIEMGDNVRAKANKENRTIELTFSSEVEYPHWHGILEVLSHAPGHCDLSRLNNSAALLFNHNLNQVIGVVERAEIRADKKGVAVVRFSKNEGLASNVWNDVQDGILRNVSVGYRILEAERTETRENGVEVWLVTKWEPYEISIVTVPADTDVGVGRSANENPNPKTTPAPLMTRAQMIAMLRARGETVEDSITDEALFLRVLASAAPAPTPANSPATTPAPGAGNRAANPNPVAPAVQTGNENTPSAADERTRAAAISALGNKYGMTEQAEKAVRDGVPAADFQATVLDEVGKRTAAFRNANAPVGLSDAELSRFSMTRAINAFAFPQSRSAQEAAAFELEVIDAQRQKRPDCEGNPIPAEVLRFCPVSGKRDAIVSLGAAGGGYAGTGSNTVETSLLAGSYFEMLRNLTTAVRLFTVLGGLSGNIDIPKQAGRSGGAGWIGEDEDASDASMTFGLLSFRPKTVAAHTAVTRKMLNQSSLDVEMLIRRNLAEEMSQAIDLAAFYGSGSGNVPRGLRYTSGINLKLFAGANPTYEEIIAMETVIQAANIDPTTARYLINAVTRGYAKSTKKFSDSGTDATIWEPGGTMNGYGTTTTNQVKTGHVFFGDWKEAMLAFWGGVDLIVDPFTDSRKLRTRITCAQDVDVQFRRPEALTWGVPTSLSAT